MRDDALKFSSSQSAKGKRFAIVAARFNPQFSDCLVEQAKQVFLEAGASSEDITIIRVPGVYEVPLPCKLLAKGKRHDAIVALGTIIEGATPHFAVLCSDITDKISQIMLDTEVPIALGVVMARNIEQAKERAGNDSGNKGREAAIAALEMVGVVREFF